MLDISTFSAFKLFTEKQYCWCPLPGQTQSGVNVSPCSTSYSLYFFVDKVLCVYVSSSAMEILQTDEVCVTEKISVTE